MISQLLDLRIFFSVSDETKDKTDEILKLVPCYIAWNNHDRINQHVYWIRND